jgi:hypothetical protein
MSSLKEFKVPEGFVPLMEGYTKAVLKYQPSNIYEFSKNYFQAQLDGDLENFIHTHEHYLRSNLRSLQDYAGMEEEFPSEHASAVSSVAGVYGSSMNSQQRVYHGSSEEDDEEMLMMQAQLREQDADMY